MKLISFMVYLTSFLFFYKKHVISAFIIGIDLGSEFLKVSLYRQGRLLEMVENYQSKTKTPFALVFTDHDRIFGSDALNKRNKLSEQLFVNMHQYIGKMFSIQESIKQIEENFVSLNLEEDPIRRGYLFSVKTNSHNYSFTTEEIFAMIFRFIQTFSSTYSQSEIKECIVSVPNFFNYKQRLAIIQSVKIAGMKLITLVNQNTASVVKYALDNNLNDEKKLIIYNMGSSYTQVSLVSILPWKKGNISKTKQQQYDTISVKIIDETWDDNLGGINFDKILMNLIVKKYKLEENNENSELNMLVNHDKRNPLIKLVNKILPFVVKYKEILSANKEINIKIPGTTENGNIIGKLTRNEFSEASSILSERIKKPIIDLLKRSGNLSIEEIDSIEFIGGATRIPFVKDVLKTIYPQDKLGNHINGDDAIALGTAFIGANYTHGLYGIIQDRKKIELLNNGVNFDSIIKITNPEAITGPRENTTIVFCEGTDSSKISGNCVRKLSQESNLFKARSNYNQFKEIKFKHDSDFIVILYEKIDYNALIDSSSDLNPIIKYKSNLSETIKRISEEDGFTFNIPRISLKFKMDELGLITVTSELSYEITKFLKLIKDDKDNITFEYVTEKIKPLTTLEKIDLISKINSNKNLSKQEKEKLIKSIKDEVGSSKVEIKLINLELIEENFEPVPLNKTDIIKSKVKLNNLDNLDEIRQKRSELKNVFESTLYNKKEWLESSESSKYGKEEELNHFRNELKKIDDWYESSENMMNYDIISEKLSLITNLFKLFDDRIDTNIKRINSIEYFHNKINSIDQELEEFLKRKKGEKIHMEEFIRKRDNALKWLEAMIKDQEELNLSDVK